MGHAIRDLIKLKVIEGSFLSAALTSLPLSAPCDRTLLIPEMIK